MIKIISAGALDKKALAYRSEQGIDGAVDTAVSEIIEQVKSRGDAALLEYTRRFDKARLEKIQVSQAEVDEALALLEPGYLEILRESAENIREFHRHQLSDGYAVTRREGIILGQRITPIRRVGLYVPGGTASYPSTVLMNAVPAKIAGVPELIICTPPGEDGTVAPEILAAASISGIDHIYKAGGAQAVAAMAYGTQSIPRVDKITGPGNAYVAAAKRRVFGMVDIDMIAGPSDILVIADETANPVFVAADMLAQAEHDRLASAVLVCLSDGFAKAVARQIQLQLEGLPRQEIARAAIEGQSMIIVARDLAQAAELSDLVAPEHLEICTRDPFGVLGMIHHAGSIFLGSYAPEALGDYYAGPNHTLPTMGTARFNSPLSVDDFVKKSSYVYYDKRALGQVQDKVADFALSEGLHAHARSVRMRFQEGDL